MKKPVVAFDMKGVSDYVIHGINGIVVRKRTGSALGAAIRELLNDPASARRMGQRGRQKALRLMDPAVGARSVQAIYDKVLNEATRPARLCCR